MEDEMAAILGVPVHLLTRDSVEQMSNPYRRESILADAKVIYHG
jgi:predicted nucleotidyltransferase